MHRLKHAKKARTETRLQPEAEPEFQIAPMIDILLVLLVFFMSISSTEVLQSNDAVRLPVAKDAKDKKGQQTQNGQVIINVLWASLTSSGTIDIDGRQFAQASDIAPILQAKVAATPEMRILVRADREVRYEYLKSLLKVAGVAGVQNVTFSVVDKEGGKK
jgi:biopolymer transport protein ExbD